MKTSKKLAFIIAAVVPAVLFGGFAMAGSFTESETSIQTADAMVVNLTETLDISDAPSFTVDENDNKHFTVELTESLSITDSVEVSSP